MPEKIEDLLGTPVPVDRNSGYLPRPDVSQQREIKKEAKAIPFAQHVKDAALAPLNNAVTRISRVLVKNDPLYKQEDNVEFYTQGMSQQFRGMFTGVLGPKSHTEAQMLRDQILEDVKIQEDAANAGAKGIAGVLLGSVLDPTQIPLMLLSGGTISGVKVAKALDKTSLAGTRASSALAVSAAGAEAGLYTGVVETVTRPSISADEIPAAIIGGIGIGGVLGGLTKTDLALHSKLKEVKAELAERRASSVKDESSVGTVPARAPDTEQGAGSPELSSEGSVGSGVVQGTTTEFESTVRSRMAPSEQKGFDEARQEFIDLDLSSKQEFDGTPQGLRARRFNDALAKTEILKTDYDRMLSWGTAGSVDAYKLLESSLGIARNNRSATMQKTMYEADILAPIIKDGKWRKLKDKWASDQGLTTFQKNVTKSIELQNQFGREVYLARSNRFLRGEYPADIHPAVKEMGDALDETYSTALGIAKGKSGEQPVHGFETLDTRPGWQPQRWVPDKIKRIIDESPNPSKTRKQLEGTLFRTYTNLYPEIDPDMLRTMAKALITRQVAKAKHIDMNLHTMLEQDGALYLTEVLQDNGLSLKRAEKFVKQLQGLDKDKGKISSARNRTDIDPSTRITGTDLQLVDLIDTDVYRVPSMYSRQVGGAAALARVGIQWADWPAKKALWKAEASARGVKWNFMDDELLDGLETYFKAGPTAGGINPATVRVLRLTNLALLNQLGLTQMMETGVIIGAVGAESFKDATVDVLRSMKDPEAVRIVDQLQDIGLMIGQYHHLFDSEYALDYVRQSAAGAKGLADYLDIALAKGQRLQGHISGFYAVQAKQQELAVTAVTMKMNKIFGKGITEKDILRLADMGLEGDTLSSIQEYFRNGTVTTEGKSLDFNFDKWNTRDLDDFKLALYRFTDQMVQKSQPGEENIWWHSEIGKPLTHLRTFTLQSMTKTFGRNMKFMDDSTRATFIYGLASAGLFYSAKQVINGKEENLTADKIARGAFGMSNMTGWIPMFYDPSMSMLGMDDMRLNHYGARGVTSDIMGGPVALPTLNRMAHIPLDALPSVLSGNYTNEDLYALRATPLVGNAYGFAAMFNEMKK